MRICTFLHILESLLRARQLPTIENILGIPFGNVHLELFSLVSLLAWCSPTVATNRYQTSRGE